jgi:hypothetical protein
LPIEYRKGRLGKLVQPARRSQTDITLNEHCEGDGAVENKLERWEAADRLYRESCRRMIAITVVVAILLAGYAILLLLLALLACAFIASVGRLPRDENRSRSDGKP